MCVVLTSSVPCRVSADRGARDAEGAVNVHVNSPSPPSSSIDGWTCKEVELQRGALHEDLHPVATKQPSTVVAGAVARDCGASDGRISRDLQEEAPTARRGGVTLDSGVLEIEPRSVVHGNSTAVGGRAVFDCTAGDGGGGVGGEDERTT